MSASRRLTLAHSPDPDDVFMWWPITGMIDPRDPSRVVSAPELDTDGFEFRAIPEDIAVECENEIALLRQGTAVVVMTLPASSGEIGVQREQVRQLVARSLGVDLMGRK